MMALSNIDKDSKRALILVLELFPKINPYPWSKLKWVSKIEDTVANLSNAEYDIQYNKANDQVNKLVDDTSFISREIIDYITQTQLYESIIKFAKFEVHIYSRDNEELKDSKLHQRIINVATVVRNLGI